MGIPAKNCMTDFCLCPRSCRAEKGKLEYYERQEIFEGIFGRPIVHDGLCFVDMCCACRHGQDESGQPVRGFGKYCEQPVKWEDDGDPAVY